MWLLCCKKLILMLFIFSKKFFFVQMLLQIFFPHRQGLFCFHIFCFFGLAMADMDRTGFRKVQNDLFVHPIACLAGGVGVLQGDRFLLEDDKAFMRGTCPSHSPMSQILSSWWGEWTPIFSPRIFPVTRNMIDRLDQGCSPAACRVWTGSWWVQWSLSGGRLHNLLKVNGCLWCCLFLGFWFCMRSHWFQLLYAATCFENIDKWFNIL